MKLIERNNYLNRLIVRRGNGLIKIITGLRRCGKSYLLFELFYKYLLSEGVKPDHVIRIALDDDIYEAYKDPAELSKYVRSQIRDESVMYYVFIDEVQYAISKEEIDGKEDVRLYNVLNGLLRLSNVDVYVTGSNSKMLSKDIMTAFRGRGDVVEVHPLSFREYYDYVGGDKLDAYSDYALYGGMPQVVLKQTDEEKNSYLTKLFEEVYFKDILERYSVGLPDILSELTDELCSAVGSLTNANKIGKTLQSVKSIKLDNKTISNYLEYLTDSFIFDQAKRYDVKGKKYFSYPYKYYCSDVGLRNARLNFRQQNEPHIMENIIYNELICRGYNVDVGVVEILQKNTETGRYNKVNCEIDFVVNKGSKRYYIQSAFSLLGDGKEATELRPLLNTNDFFKKIVVTMSHMKPWLDEAGVLRIGLLDFLLNEDSLEF